MLWLKAFHIVFMVTWFAGLFYLPRLLVYFVEAAEPDVRGRLKVMQRRGVEVPRGDELELGHYLLVCLGRARFSLDQHAWLLVAALANADATSLTSRLNCGSSSFR